MPYFDIDEEQEQTPAAEAEARRKVLGMIAGAGKTSVLGNRGQPTPDLTGATNQPRVPAPRFADPMAPSALNFATPALGSRPPALGTVPAQPVRPNIAPTRED